MAPQPGSAIQEMIHIRAGDVDGSTQKTPHCVQAEGDFISQLGSCPSPEFPLALTEILYSLEVGFFCIIRYSKSVIQKNILE